MTSHPVLREIERLYSENDRLMNEVNRLEAALATSRELREFDRAEISRLRAGLATISESEPNNFTAPMLRGIARSAMTTGKSDG